MSTAPFQATDSGAQRFMSYCTRFVLHLRLTFNVVLAPLFVWGAFVSDSVPSWRFWVGFLSFHVFLYGGTNMFNSYYDRDEGPIGGLERPPPVDRGLLIGSLIMKGIGFVMACSVGTPFVICYLLFTCFSVGYSHPAIRIKRRPYASAVTVFVGQGVVGYVAGWLACGGTLERLWEATAFLGGLGGAVMVSALYPLTQIYQLEDDRRRADMTLARRLGMNLSFLYIMLLLAVGAACVGVVFWSKGFRLEAVLVAAYFCAGLVYLARLRADVATLIPTAIYRRVMRFNYFNSAVLLTLLGAHLVHRTMMQ
jgi:4-hydroxybenzoate polyprenyltransferase